MSGLPWVRLDSHIGTHDKVEALLAARDGHRAFTLYVCALGWSCGHGTDGFIPKHCLAVNHGTVRLAQLLIEHRLWEYDPEGGGNFRIRNYVLRQESSFVTDTKRDVAQSASRKGNCIRWHGADCGCWKHHA